MFCPSAPYIIHVSCANACTILHIVARHGVGDLLLTPNRVFSLYIDSLYSTASIDNIKLLREIYVPVWFILFVSVSISHIFCLSKTLRNNVLFFRSFFPRPRPVYIVRQSSCLLCPVLCTFLPVCLLFIHTLLRLFLYTSVWIRR
jgi:hypothetical protein